MDVGDVHELQYPIIDIEHRSSRHMDMKHMTTLALLGTRGLG